VFVAVSITVIDAESWFGTYTRFPSGVTSSANGRTPVGTIATKVAVAVSSTPTMLTVCSLLKMLT
jgi:hypothetical protein